MGSPGITQCPVPQQGVNPPVQFWTQVQNSTDGILVWNQDINNTVYVGNQSNISPNGLNILPIPPNQSFVLSQGLNWWVIGNASGIANLVVIPGASATFLGLTQGMGNLAIPSIHSPNFVHNVSGWSIDQNGNVEFNSGTFRGAVEGGSFIGTGGNLEFLLYTGTPAANNLALSSCTTPGTDPFGNAVFSGFTVYTKVGPGSYTAFNTLGSELTVYTATSEAGPWTLQSDIAYNSAGFNFNGSLFEFVLPSAGDKVIVTAGTKFAAFTAGNMSRLAEVSQGSSIISAYDASLSDTTTIPSGNVIVPTDITHQYPTDVANGAVAGSIYTLKTWFNGVWGNQVMTISADINGSFTTLCTIGGAFGASGDNIDGWLEMEVEIVSPTTCRIHMSGGIRNIAAATNILAGNTATVSSTVVTGVTIAAGDTIAIAINFAASVIGQTIQTQGSRFTRHV